MKYLIENGADINSKNRVIKISKLQHDETALVIAARHNYFDCLKFLIDNGAEIHQDAVDSCF